MVKLGKMMGHKKYLVWCERKYGQLKPSKLENADTLKEATKKASRMTCPSVFILKIERAWQQYR